MWSRVSLKPDTEALHIQSTLINTWNNTLAILYGHLLTTWCVGRGAECYPKGVNNGAHVASVFGAMCCCEVATALLGSHSTQFFYIVAGISHNRSIYEKLNLYLIHGTCTPFRIWCKCFSRQRNSETHFDHSCQRHRIDFVCLCFRTKRCYKNI